MANERSKLGEWVVEAVDHDGDIIDPEVAVDRKKAHALARELVMADDVQHVDIAWRMRYYEGDELVEQTYKYTCRYIVRDGFPTSTQYRHTL
jgi:hypothetical protein